jgi:replicative DNA helicase
MNLPYPHNLEAERNLIGCLLLQPDLMPLAVQDLRPDMFYNTTHRAVYGAIETLYNAGRQIEYVAVHELASKELQPFSIVEVIEYTNGVTRVYGFENYIAIIRDKFVKRELLTKCLHSAIKSSKDESAGLELLADHTAELSGISNQSQRELTLTEMILQLNNERDSLGVANAGYRTGYPTLDQCFSLNPSDLFVLAGRPGQGKSAVAVNWMLNLAQQNIPVAFISLEMSWQQLLTRMESILTGIDHERIKSNRLTEEERAKIASEERRAAKFPLYISDLPRTTPENLRAKISLYVAKYGVRVVFVDYLQLIRGKGRDRYEQVSDVSVQLKAIAKEFGVCLVALAQLSREVEKRDNKIPQESDLRDSGQIEQDADVILFVMRPEYYQMETVSVGGVTHDAAGKMVFKLAKYRHGTPGQTRLMDWNGDRMQLGEVNEYF